MKVFLLLCLAWSFSAFAEEVDDFTTPSSPPADATAQVNQLTNLLLQRALTWEAQNAKEQNLNPCDPAALNITLRRSIGGDFRSEFRYRVTAAETMLDGHEYTKQKFNDGDPFTPGIPNQTELDLWQAGSTLSRLSFGKSKNENSVYAGTVVKACCETHLQVAGISVGLDKLDHFFNTGLGLWEKAEERVSRPRSQLEKNTAALAVGTAWEHDVQGLAFTNVKSYADMAANWSGYKFWRELLEPGNYFACQSGQWKQVKEFKIENYVDASWNESINCSSYIDPNTRDRVSANIKKLGFDACPVDRHACQELAKKYSAEGDYVTKSILHPNCLDPKANFSSVEDSKFDWAFAFKMLKALSARDAIGFVKNEFGGGTPCLN